MLNSTIVNIAQNTEDEIKNLKRSISRKRRILVRITDKFEQLQIEIDLIEEEYKTRVGTLFRKDLLLDLELQRNKKINEFITKGLSYEDAVMQVNELMREEVKEEEEDERYYLGKDENTEITLEAKIDIRKLWKKLVHKFHPDLTNSSQDKKEREEIMKKINIAYKNNDYETLKVISEKELVEEVEDLTVTFLEKRFVEIENAILSTKNRFIELKKTEWYAWWKKTKKEKEALFNDLERKLIRQILVKEEVLRNLKKYQ